MASKLSVRILICLVYSVLILSGCKTVELTVPPFGEFEAKGRDYRYVVFLREDSTFTHKIYIMGASPSCDGKWEYLGGNKLLLTCDPVEDISELISSGYLNERERQIIIINRNKISKDGLIFKRKRTPSAVRQKRH